MTHTLHSDPRTRAEREAHGRGLRAEVPRSAHATFDPGPDRDPLALLREQDATRVPELLPIRYGRMAASPFAFYRGAALPMAADLARTPRTGIRAQACGDAHLSNFGMFASPERRLVFDINDFDETLPAPWEWDVKRLVTSVEIAAREIGLDERDRREAVAATAAGYRTAMARLATRTSLDVWYALADLEDVREQYATLLQGRREKRFSQALDKARSRDNLGSLRRFATTRDGALRIAADPPLVVPLDDLGGRTDQMHEVLEAYRASLEPERRPLMDRYTLVDVARKVVGVGSVGTRSWMLLFLGEDADDPLFLQAKEAGASVLEQFAGASAYGHAGRRVVVGQRLMQTVSDVFLGWVRVEGLDGRPRDFYVRQLRDWKGSIDVGALRPRGLRAYGELCGWTLARAHARTGDRFAIAAYLGRGTAFDEAVAEFARAYADHNERDHEALLAAISRGEVAAETGI